MSTTTAASLAILKVNWERRSLDYLDNFTPFLVSALASGNDDAVSIQDLQDRIKSAHGLTLPLHALKTLLNRAAKEGFVRRESGVFFRDLSRCRDGNFADLRTEVEQGVARLVSALAGFASEKCGQHWSDTQAELALISFIADEGLETLYASVEGRVIEVPPPSIDSSYIVGSFSASVQTTKPELFEDFLTVAKGTLLANALYLPDTSRAAQRFVGTKVYLDTSILVYACGFAGKDREAPARELLTLLRQYGAELGCFRETVEEVRGILDSCAAMIRTKNLRYSFGPSMEFFIAAGHLSTDIDLMAARCEKHIEKLGVRIEDRPAVDRAYQIDELSLQQLLKREVGYKKQAALIHDVDCVSAILRHRKGSESNSIENCRAILATTNFDLARAAKQFFQPDVPPGTVAPCITANALANILWLKNPTTAPNLPRSRVIADAFAAMQPPEPLWKVYLTEIARLKSSGDISPDDYYLLRHHHSAKRALMDLTHGVTDTFSEGTVKEVLEMARQNLRADLTQELADTRLELSEREGRLSESARASLERGDRIDQFAESFAKIVAAIAFFPILAVLGLGALYTFPLTVPSLKAAWWRYVAAGVLGLFFLFTIVNIGWGTSIKKVVDALRAWVALNVSKRIKSYLDPSTTEKG